MTTTASESAALAGLAAVFEFPRLGLWYRVDHCVVRVQEVYPNAAEPLRAFRESLRDRSLAELEELYIQTFDMDPASCLDLGWQLFGEDYNRGLFLARLRREMDAAGVEENPRELPDHLTQVLRLLQRMEPAAADDFVLSCVLPALEKIAGAAPASRLYGPALAAVIRLLSHRHRRANEPREARNGVFP